MQTLTVDTAITPAQSVVALGIAYDGRDWNGWQTQPHSPNLQDTLERALAKICLDSEQGTQHTIPTICAGRTDTGVHAAMQVVHITTPVDRPLTAWVRGVNAFLPDSMGVQWAQVVPPDFHARFSALSRTYVYLLKNGRVRPSHWIGKAGWTHWPLELAPMQHAAKLLIGEHDFTSFRSSQCQAKSPVRTLHSIQIEQQADLFIITIKANAFLHHMVRNIMGALVEIGASRAPVSLMNELLEVKDRTKAPSTFSPEGLYLTAVEYPPHFGLKDCDRTANVAQRLF